jgi:hypothetical protein
VHYMKCDETERKKGIEWRWGGFERECLEIFGS